MIKRNIALLFLSLQLAAFSGCGGPVDDPTTEDTSNLARRFNECTPELRYGCHDYCDGKEDQCTSNCLIDPDTHDYDADCQVRCGTTGAICHQGCC